MWQVLEKDFVNGRTWSSAKLYLLKNDIAVADRSVPLAVKIWDILSFRCDHQHINRLHVQK